MGSGRMRRRAQDEGHSRGVPSLDLPQIHLRPGRGVGDRFAPGRSVPRWPQLSFDPPELLRAPYWPSPEGPAKGARTKLWRKKISVRLTSGKQIDGLGRHPGDHEPRTKRLHPPLPRQGHWRRHPARRRKGNELGFRPRQIFGQAGSYRAQSYIGEFDVTALGKSITTDSTLWTPDEEADFVEHVLEQLKAGKWTCGRWPSTSSAQAQSGR